jgi:hypothetical protein
VPVGALVIVIVFGAGFTVSAKLFVALAPKASLTLTARVHPCGTPLRLAGAVHVGFCTSVPGENVPWLPRAAGQLALHA